MLCGKLVCYWFVDYLTTPFSVTQVKKTVLVHATEARGGEKV
jgi:hypothetical protein